MAIPFNLPSDQDTEAVCHRLEQILLDLYGVLRLLVPRPATTSTATNTDEVTEETEEEDEGQTRAIEMSRNSMVLPDVVPKLEVPRRRRRRLPVQRPGVFQMKPSSWLNLGIEVRLKASDFTTGIESGEVTEKRVQLKATSLFSLLSNAPITGSLWTTLILLAGWKLLRQS